MFFLMEFMRECPWAVSCSAVLKFSVCAGFRSFSSTLMSVGVFIWWDLADKVHANHSGLRDGLYEGKHLVPAVGQQDCFRLRGCQWDTSALMQSGISFAVVSHFFF